MNTGQILLTIGALMILSVAVFNVNKMLVHSDFLLSENRYRLEALSLLTSYVEQTSQYYFDEASTDSSSLKNLEDFTLPGNLGFEDNDLGEIDDFDDLNQVVRIDTGRSGVIYKIYFQIDYVTLQGNNIVSSNEREYHKQMMIYIMDNYDPPLICKYENGAKVRDTLRVSFVRSYWFYN